IRGPASRPLKAQEGVLVLDQVHPYILHLVEDCVFFHRFLSCMPPPSHPQTTFIRFLSCMPPPSHPQTTVKLTVVRQLFSHRLCSRRCGYPPDLFRNEREGIGGSAQ